MKKIKILFYLLGIFAIVGAEDVSSDVIVLTEENFDEFTTQGSWLIEFYAPWCGHCKKLAPIYEKAATALVGKVNLGSVDCTQHKALKRKFEIRGFPTIKFFREGNIRDYKGSRTLEGFKEFASLVTGDPVRKATPGNLPSLLKENSVTFLLIDSETGWIGTQSFADHAYAMQGTTHFASMTYEAATKTGKKTPAVVNRYGLKKSDLPVIIRLCDGCEQVQFEGNIDDKDEFQEWVQDNWLPLVSTLDSSNFDEVMNSGKVAYLFVYNPKDSQAEQFLDQFQSFAQAYGDTFTYATVDGIKFHRYLKQFKVGPEAVPTLFALDFPAEQFYEFPYGSGKSASTEERTLTLKSFKNAVKSFAENIENDNIERTNLVAWYNPQRAIKALEKLMSGYSETTIAIVVAGSMFLMIGILIFGCIYVDSTATAEEAQRAAKKAE